MTNEHRSRAAELAALQVESIVSSVQAAAEELRSNAAREAEEIRAAARRDAAEELEAARVRSMELIEDARQEAARLRHDAQRAVRDRVADAEEAAHQVLEDARQLTTGLRRLGEALGDQAEQILREVHAAHRRMQADLRVDVGGERERPSRLRRASERDPAVDAGAPRGSSADGRGNLDVPPWVGRRSSAGEP
jgi:hypothetical protein